MIFRKIRARIGACVLAASLPLAAVAIPETAAASTIVTCTGVSAPAPCLDWYGGGLLFGPRVHPIFWGAWWNTKKGAAIQGYVDSLLLGLGTEQDKWTTILNQYGAAISPYYNGIGLNGPLLDGSTVDTSNPPPHPTKQQIGDEAAAYGALPGAVIPLVLTPPGVVPQNDTSSQVCAHHSATPQRSGYLWWAEVPYAKASSVSCNRFNGTLAGYSMLIGHEIAETITDPYPNGALDTPPSWLNSQGDEIGDMCEPGFDFGGVFTPKNIFTLKLPTGNFKMQDLWSNSAGKCVEHSLDLSRERCGWGPVRPAAEVPPCGRELPTPGR